MASLMYQFTTRYAKYVCSIKNANIINKYSRSYATFHPREFYHESSDGENGTLIHTFAKYISLTKNDYTDKTLYKIKYSSFYPVYQSNTFMDLLRNIDNHDIPKLLVFTCLYRSKADIMVFTDVLNALDAECAKRITNMNTKEILAVLHGFMYMIPNKIRKLETFNLAIPRLLEIFGENPTHQNFMQIIFFTALFKQDRAGGDYLRQFLNRNLDVFLNDEMSSMDFAILCNSTFKTSIKITNEYFQKRLVEEILKLDDDPALVVTLIKTARLNRVKSHLVVEKLQGIILNKNKNLDLRAYVHLFAYFADNLFKDDRVSQHITDFCMRQLNLEHRNGDKNFRPKDLATFLWACSTLNLNLTQNYDLMDVAKVIENKIEDKEYKYCPNELIDSALSLWILNYHSTELVAAIMTNREFARSNSPEQVKIESRKDLLLSCVEIEKPETMRLIARTLQNAFQRSRAAPNYLIENRQSLQMVHSVLESLSEKYMIANISYVAPVKYLNYPGILIEIDDKLINFEVLDDTNTLNDGKHPIGLFNMKLRILKNAGCHTIVINTNETSDEDDLKVLLEKHLEEITDKNQQESSVQI